ncbi:hypothetical protein EVAR_71585_1 [Eumeta japonica]|uniref:Uncharacterized protein n=1 Tax=Eumeta variegata TaxID=151549 RepID=A0A4C1TTK9_EUMVA|nr:hypothetical protein EVAR_71585_1 [Eumeta japonica]
MQTLKWVRGYGSSRGNNNGDKVARQWMAFQEALHPFMHFHILSVVFKAGTDKVVAEDHVFHFKKFTNKKLLDTVSLGSQQDDWVYLTMTSAEVSIYKQVSSVT